MGNEAKMRVFEASGGASNGPPSRAGGSLMAELRSVIMFITTVRISIFLVTHIYFPASGQAVVTGVAPSFPRFLPSIFIAHKVQQSHCSSIFHQVLLIHALALSASIIDAD